MFFSLTFDINKNVIKVYNNKNVKFLYQNLVCIALESSRCISSLKKHHLILKMTIIGFDSYLLFITFFNLYLMINIK